MKKNTTIFGSIQHFFDKKTNNNPPTPAPTSSILYILKLCENKEKNSVARGQAVLVNTANLGLKKYNLIILSEYGEKLVQS